MKIVRQLLSVSILLGASTASADQPPSGLEIEQRVAEAMLVETRSHCGTEAGMDLVLCWQERLQTLDHEMDFLIARALEATDNMWGEQASAEQRQNIRDAQTAWMTFRREDCWFDYVPGQHINSSWRQMENFLCEINTTLRRMEQVRIRYLNDWR